MLLTEKDIIDELQKCSDSEDMISSSEEDYSLGSESTGELSSERSFSYSDDGIDLDDNAVDDLSYLKHRKHDSSDDDTIGEDDYEDMFETDEDDDTEVEDIDDDNAEV